jgi:hypothetical protein
VRVEIVVQRLPDARNAVGEFRIARLRKTQHGIRDGDATIAANATVAGAAAIAPIAGIGNGAAGVPDGFRVGLKIREALKINLLRTGLRGTGDCKFTK